MTPGIHAGAEEGQLALLLELRGQRHLVEVRLVDGLRARLALRHVDVGGAALEARRHDRLVELGDDGVDDELAALAGLGDGVGVGGVDELRERLAVADLAGDERGALLVVVCDDDLGDGRVAAEVPGEDLTLHAGADDKDLHRALSLLVTAPGRTRRLPLTDVVLPRQRWRDKRREDDYRRFRYVPHRMSRRIRTIPSVFAPIRPESRSPSRTSRPARAWRRTACSAWLP